MSYDTVRAAILSTVLGTVPENKTGADRFSEAKNGDVESSGVDRAFSVELVTPPAQTGQNLNLASWRFTATVEVSIWYSARSRLVMDSSIAQDSIALQKKLLTPSNMGADFSAYVPRSDGHIGAAILDDKESNAKMLVLSLTFIHK